MSLVLQYMVDSVVMNTNYQQTSTNLQWSHINLGFVDAKLISSYTATTDKALKCPRM